MESLTQFNTVINNNTELLYNNIYIVNWDITSKNYNIKKQSLFCKTCGNYIKIDLSYTKNLTCKC